MDLESQKVNMKGICTVSFLVALLTVAGLPCQSAAQPNGMPPRELQGTQPPLQDPLSAGASRWDLNQDGVFTCEEWKQFMSSVFARADKNKDGFLSASEFDDLRASEHFLASADVGYFDDDRDHRVSRKEFIEKPSPFFARYDANGDCRVTAEEMKGRAIDAKEKRGPPGKGGGMGMPGRGGY
jgi:hypothetical protein